MLYFYDESLYADGMPTTGRMNEPNRRVASAVARIVDENVSPSASIRIAQLANDEGIADFTTGRIGDVINVEPGFIVQAAGTGLRFSADRASAGATGTWQLARNGALIVGTDVQVGGDISISAVAFAAGEVITLVHIAGPPAFVSLRVTYTQQLVAV